MNQIIIDTREAFEYTAGHVDGAINIPPMEFMSGDVPAALKDTPTDTPIILYCRTGSRSNVVANILQQHGFTNITNGINQGHVEKLLANS